MSVVGRSEAVQTPHPHTERTACSRRFLGKIPSSLLLARFLIRAFYAVSPSRRDWPDIMPCMDPLPQWRPIHTQRLKSRSKLTRPRSLTCRLEAAMMFWDILSTLRTACHVRAHCTWRAHSVVMGNERQKLAVKWLTGAQQGVKALARRQNLSHHLARLQSC